MTLFRKKPVQVETCQFPELNEHSQEWRARFTDDVLAKLKGCLWHIHSESKDIYDLALTSGMSIFKLKRIFSGRKKNITIDEIAILSRAMRFRPELVLHDMRDENKPDLFDATYEKVE